MAKPRPVEIGPANGGRLMTGVSADTAGIDPLLHLDWLFRCGFSETAVDRFFASIEKTETCWLWTRSKKYGYGRFSHGPPNSWMLAHRASWMIHFGPIPDGLSVLHNCPCGDNPACVNPLHLWLGTQVDNTADMKQKRRSCFGERHWNHKLTREQVEWIKATYYAGRLLQKEIGAIFGVSNRTISKIITGETWGLA